MSYSLLLKATEDCFNMEFYSGNEIELADFFSKRANITENKLPKLWAFDFKYSNI
eukprot:CAMPEP_0176405830 /NCGR_PEP_ID=MMETSP0127-20121128/552_1 /TAXON_ID=938130 /ORGANISM="Platyophrya macrostoma, Strain WH" /LENGTH=54 /DNA_ID=CAMNT_0017784925 /DNA_START=243 /DNA_END=407 /DNA_ORIENTATION=-